MSVESDFVAAARQHRVCRITDASGSSREVEPYMVYISPKGKRLFHCFQLRGFSESGKPIGWKNPEVASFLRAEQLAGTFSIRPEYNPGNTKMFPEIIFSLPK